MTLRPFRRHADGLGFKLAVVVGTALWGFSVGDNASNAGMINVGLVLLLLRG